jgi:hypothetical protein
MARGNDRRGGACDAIRDQGRPDRWVGEREREVRLMVGRDSSQASR